MVAPSGFHGFPREAVQFFENLIWNNNRAWFQEHKEAYQETVLVPAVKFVRVMPVDFERMQNYMKQARDSGQFDDEQQVAEAAFEMHLGKLAGD